ncbi:MAG: hypothetical protein ACFE0J_17505 [Elainellaceae cyanobacterium]
MKKQVLQAVFLLFTALTFTYALPSAVKAQEEQATRIQFARGSYCGSYSGNFSGGREFVLNLGSGQTFTSRNIGGGIQYDLYVYGPDGRLDGNQIASDQINYQTRAAGDHYIYIQSTNRYTAVEFCAY